MATLKKRKKTKRGGKISMIIFGGIFLTVGLAITKPILITPLQKMQAAKSWDTVPAVVDSSEVKTHSSSDGDTYSVYIRYRYSFNSQEYTGDKSSFMGGSSSGYESKAEKVRQNPPGKEITVYVNPTDPSESVINRKLGAELLFGLIPLVFALVGAGIIFAAFHKGKFRKLDQKQAGEHVIRLKPKSPIGKLVAITIFAIIWNSVVVFLFIADAPMLFKVLFGLAGLGVIAGVIHALLACFNPRPTVELTPGNMHPGTNAALRWAMTGRADRIGSLEISLRCLHITTETRRSGGKTQTSVVKTPIFTKELLCSENQSEIAQGTISFTLPHDQPASRRSNSDGIEWQLLYHGDIPKWPDIKEEFKFLVYPENQGL